MTIAFETGLIILLLAFVAVGIAVLGDHVNRMLNRNDAWPDTPMTRRHATPATARRQTAKLP